MKLLIELQLENKLYCSMKWQTMLLSCVVSQVWATLLSPVTPTLPRSITLFIAVPIFYAKLITEHERRLARGRGTRRAKEYVKAVCSTKIR